MQRGEDAPPLVNPFASDDQAAVERGAVVFKNFCQPCHGPVGEADGLVVVHGFPAPPPLKRGQTQRKTDAELFQIVTNGQNTMPGYGLQLSRDDRWRVILHVRTFRRAAQAREVEAK